MEEIQDRVDLMRAESERLGHYLDALSPEAWRQQSACELWSVADVLAHIIGGAERYVGSITRGLQGDADSPEGYPTEGGAPSQLIGNVNAQMAFNLREDAGDQLLARFHSTNDQLNRLLSGLNSGDWDTLCYHPAGKSPVRAFVTMRMLELALHGWDMASSLDPKARLSPESLPMSMDFIIAAAYRLVRPAADQQPAVKCRFRLGEAAEGYDAVHYDLILEGGSARMEKAGHSPADVVLQCGMDDFLLLMTGRLAVDAAISQGKLVVQEGSKLPSDFGEWFKGLLPPSDV